MFDGSVYDPMYDETRLKKQIGRVFACMCVGEWRTLSEITTLTGDPESSISAQLRHLRKPRFGSYRVEKRPRGDRGAGLFEYRILPPAAIVELDGQGRFFAPLPGEIAVTMHN